MLLRDDGELVLLTADSQSNNYQTDVSASLSLREVYEKLESSGKRFVLFVDGCLQSERIDEFRDSLGLVLPGGHGQMHYIGPEDLITNELRLYSDAVDAFADEHDYLHTNNPVILAAKPGTVAPGVADPLNEWGSVHGPLSGRIVRNSYYVNYGESNRQLQDLVRSTVDFNGVGQLTSEGTISWSDFEAFRTIGLSGTVTKQSKMLTKKPFDGITHLTPFADESGLWISDFNGDIWEYHFSDVRREKIISKEPFKVMAGIAGTNHTVIYDGWDHSIVIQRKADADAITVAENIGIDVLKGYPNPTVLVIENNGDISILDGVFRLEGDQLQRLFDVEASDVFDAVDADNGAVYLSMPELGVISRVDAQSRTVYVTGLTDPALIFHTNRYLYVSSGDGLTIYRIDQNKKVEMFTVTEYFDVKDLPYHSRRAFTVLGQDRLIFGVDGFLYEIDSKEVDWKTLEH